MEQLINSPLAYLLSKYFSNVDISTLGFLGNDIRLNDLELDPKFINESGALPPGVRVVRGYVKALRIRVPLLSVLSNAKNIRIEVDTCEIVVRSDAEAARATKSLSRAAGSSSEASGETSSFLSNLMLSTEVFVSNMVFRYEHRSVVDVTFTAASLSVCTSSVDEDFVIKPIELKGASLSVSDSSKKEKPMVRRVDLAGVLKVCVKSLSRDASFTRVENVLKRATSVEIEVADLTLDVSKAHLDCLAALIPLKTSYEAVVEEVVTSPNHQAEASAGGGWMSYLVDVFAEDVADDDNDNEEQPLELKPMAASLRLRRVEINLSGRSNVDAATSASAPLDDSFSSSNKLLSAQVTNVAISVVHLDEARSWAKLTTEHCSVVSNDKCVLTCSSQEDVSADLLRPSKISSSFALSLDADLWKKDLSVRLGDLACDFDYSFLSDLTDLLEMSPYPLTENLDEEDAETFLELGSEPPLSPSHFETSRVSEPTFKTFNLILNGVAVSIDEYASIVAKRWRADLTRDNASIIRLTCSLDYFETLEGVCVAQSIELSLASEWGFKTVAARIDLACERASLRLDAFKISRAVRCLNDLKDFSFLSGVCDKETEQTREPPRCSVNGLELSAGLSGGGESVRVDSSLSLGGLSAFSSDVELFRSELTKDDVFARIEASSERVSDTHRRELLKIACPSALAAPRRYNPEIDITECKIGLKMNKASARYDPSEIERIYEALSSLPTTASEPSFETHDERPTTEWVVSTALVRPVVIESEVGISVRTPTIKTLQADVLEVAGLELLENESRIVDVSFVWLRKRNEIKSDSAWRVCVRDLQQWKALAGLIPSSPSSSSSSSSSKTATSRSVSVVLNSGVECAFADFKFVVGALSYVVDFVGTDVTSKRTTLSLRKVFSAPSYISVKYDSEFEPLDDDEFLRHVHVESAVEAVETVYVRGFDLKVFPVLWRALELLPAGGNSNRPSNYARAATVELRLGDSATMSVFDSEGDFVSISMQAVLLRLGGVTAAFEQDEEVARRARARAESLSSYREELRKDVVEVLGLNLTSSKGNLLRSPFSIMWQAPSDDQPASQFVCGDFDVVLNEESYFVLRNVLDLMPKKRETSKSATFTRRKFRAVGSLERVSVTLEGLLVLYAEGISVDTETIMISNVACRVADGYGGEVELVSGCERVEISGWKSVSILSPDVVVRLDFASLERVLDFLEHPAGLSKGGSSKVSLTVATQAVRFVASPDLLKAPKERASVAFGWSSLRCRTGETVSAKLEGLFARVSSKNCESFVDWLYPCSLEVFKDDDWRFVCNDHVELVFSDTLVAAVSKIKDAFPTRLLPNQANERVSSNDDVFSTSLEKFERVLYETEVELNEPSHKRLVFFSNVRDASWLVEDDSPLLRVVDVVEGRSSGFCFTTPFVHSMQADSGVLFGKRAEEVEFKSIGRFVFNQPLACPRDFSVWCVRFFDCSLSDINACADSLIISVLKTAPFRSVSSYSFAKLDLVVRDADDGDAYAAVSAINALAKTAKNSTVIRADLSLKVFEPRDSTWAEVVPRVRSLYSKKDSHTTWRFNKLKIRADERCLRILSKKGQKCGYALENETGVEICYSTFGSSHTKILRVNQIANHSELNCTCGKHLTTSARGLRLGLISLLDDSVKWSKDVVDLDAVERGSHKQVRVENHVWTVFFSNGCFKIKGSDEIRFHELLDVVPKVFLEDGCEVKVYNNKAHLSLPKFLNASRRKVLLENVCELRLDFVERQVLRINGSFHVAEKREDHIEVRPIVVFESSLEEEVEIELFEVSRSQALRYELDDEQHVRIDENRTPEVSFTLSKGLKRGLREIDPAKTYDARANSRGTFKFKCFEHIVHTVELQSGKFARITCSDSGRVAIEPIFRIKNESHRDVWVMPYDSEDSWCRETPYRVEARSTTNVACAVPNDASFVALLDKDFPLSTCVSSELLLVSIFDKTVLIEDSILIVDRDGAVTKERGSILTHVRLDSNTIQVSKQCRISLSKDVQFFALNGELVECVRIASSRGSESLMFELRIDPFPRFVLTKSIVLLEHEIEFRSAHGAEVLLKGEIVRPSHLAPGRMFKAFEISEAESQVRNEGPKLFDDRFADVIAIDVESKKRLKIFARCLEVSGSIELQALPSVMEAPLGAYLRERVSEEPISSASSRLSVEVEHLCVDLIAPARATTAERRHPLLSAHFLKLRCSKTTTADSCAYDASCEKGFQVESAFGAFPVVLKGENAASFHLSACDSLDSSSRFSRIKRLKVSCFPIVKANLDENLLRRVLELFENSPPLTPSQALRSAPTIRRIEFMEISKVFATVTLRRASGSSALLSLDNAPIHVSESVWRGAIGTDAYFVREMASSLLADVVLGLPAIVGSLDVLFAPTSFVRSTVSWSALGDAALLSVFKFSSALARAMRARGNRENENDDDDDSRDARVMRTHTLYSGLEHFTRGFVEGASGVVSTPFEEISAEDPTLKSVLFGVVRGLLNLVLRPAEGTARLLESTSGGLLLRHNVPLGLTNAESVLFSEPDENSLFVVDCSRTLEALVDARVDFVEHDVLFEDVDACENKRVLVFVAAEFVAGIESCALEFAQEFEFFVSKANVVSVHESVVKPSLCVLVLNDSVVRLTFPSINSKRALLKHFA